MPQDASRLAGVKEAVAIGAIDDPDVVHPLLRESGLQSLAAAPLTLDHGLIGALHVGSLPRRDFSRAGGLAAQPARGPRGAGGSPRPPLRARARHRRDAPAKPAAALAAARPRVHDGRPLPARPRPTRASAATGTTSIVLEDGRRRDRDRRRLRPRHPRRGADGAAPQRAARVRVRGLPAVGGRRPARQPRAPARDRLVRDARLRRDRAGRRHRDARERRPPGPAARLAGGRGAFPRRRGAAAHSARRAPRTPSRRPRTSCRPGRCSSSTRTVWSSGAAPRCSTRSSNCARWSPAGPADAGGAVRARPCRPAG